MAYANPLVSLSEAATKVIFVGFLGIQHLSLPTGGLTTHCISVNFRSKTLVTSTSQTFVSLLPAGCFSGLDPFFVEGF